MATISIQTNTVRPSVNHKFWWYCLRGGNINMARPSTFLESRSWWGHDCGKSIHLCKTKQLALKAYCPNRYTLEVKQSKRSTVAYSILFYLYVQQNLLLYYWDPLSRKKAVLPSCCYCFFFCMPAENLPPYGLEVQYVLLLRFCKVEPKKVL